MPSLCRSGALGAAFYFFAANYALTAFLPPVEAATLLILVFVLKALLTEVTGWSWDWSALAANTLLRVT